MKFNAEVSQVKVASRINTEPAVPADVELTVDVYRDKECSFQVGEVTVRIPFTQAKAYVVGRKVTLTIEPAKGKR